MKFYELLEKCKWENIQPVILAICQQRGPCEYVEKCLNDKDGYDCFEDAFNILKNTVPASSDVIIMMKQCEDDPSDEESSVNETYIDVFCIMKDSPNDRCGFCCPWDESLVSVNSPQNQ
ncbi:MAG: hypothetical protein LBH60_01460, partial [Prevotellaceae bacterium]|nr:hypothetical protein [Prevotellaceae bacterium]